MTKNFIKIIHGDLFSQLESGVNALLKRLDKKVNDDTWVSYTVSVDFHSEKVHRPAKIAEVKRYAIVQVEAILPE